MFLNLVVHYNLVVFWIWVFCVLEFCCVLDFSVYWISLCIGDVYRVSCCVLTLYTELFYTQNTRLFSIHKYNTQLQYTTNFFFWRQPKWIFVAKILPDSGPIQWPAAAPALQPLRLPRAPCTWKGDADRVPTAHLPCEHVWSSQFASPTLSPPATTAADWPREPTLSMWYTGSGRAPLLYTNSQTESSGSVWSSVATAALDVNGESHHSTYLCWCPVPWAEDRDATPRRQHLVSFQPHHLLRPYPRNVWHTRRLSWHGAECLTKRRGPAAAQKAVPTAAPRTSRNAKQAMPERSLSSSPAAIRHVEHSRPEHSRPAQVRDVSSCFQKSMSEALNTPPLQYWPRSNRLSRTLVVVLRPL